MADFYKLTSGRILSVEKDPYAPNPRDPRQNVSRLYSFSRVYKSPDVTTYATFQDLCRGYGVDPVGYDEDIAALNETNEGIKFYPLSVVTVEDTQAYAPGFPDTYLGEPGVTDAVFVGVAILPLRPQDTLRLGWKIDPSAEDYDKIALEILLAELAEYSMWANDEVYVGRVFTAEGDLIPELTVYDAYGEDPTENGICETLGDGVVCMLDADELAETFAKTGED